uniref:Uncharacterized protein n=1 Tax=uncultured Caudovirales phage TaxID=2100421 RepID=A0A6J5L612_9CAUD|nr:hypothetical protein UFOVP114_7 [uncultured Caudovirales phage]
MSAPLVVTVPAPGPGELAQPCFVAVCAYCPNTCVTNVETVNESEQYVRRRGWTLDIRCMWKCPACTKGIKGKPEVAQRPPLTSAPVGGRPRTP